MIYSGYFLSAEHCDEGVRMTMAQVEPPAAPPGTGILELRKEKSRDAARSRRGKENKEFYELAKMLPLPAAITSQLDKASIIRLTISYLKLRDFSHNGDPPWGREHPPVKHFKGVSNRQRSSLSYAYDVFDPHQGHHLLQALDGFVFILSSDGKFLYISETVSIYLGLSQVDMTGSSVFEYIHAADQAELAEQLGLTLTTRGAGETSAASPEGGSTHSTAGSPDDSTRLAPSPLPHNPDVATLMTLNPGSSNKGLNRSICLRMKSTLTKRGCHFKSSGYRVVQMIYRLRPQYQFPSRKSPPPLLGMAGIAVGLPPPAVHEVRLENEAFVARLGFDFKIAHCEAKVSELLDYTPEELTGRSLYKLCHAEDVNIIRDCHVDLIKKGQILTPYYRILNKQGGFTWLQTCATVVCNSKTSEEQSIICINSVISACEFENYVLDNFQLGIGLDCDMMMGATERKDLLVVPKAETAPVPDALYETATDASDGDLSRQDSSPRSQLSLASHHGDIGGPDCAGATGEHPSSHPTPESSQIPGADCGDRSPDDTPLRLERGRKRVLEGRGGPQRGAAGSATDDESSCGNQTMGSSAAMDGDSSGNVDLSVRKRGRVDDDQPHQQQQQPPPHGRSRGGVSVPLASGGSTASNAGGRGGSVTPAATPIPQPIGTPLSSANEHPASESHSPNTGQMSQQTHGGWSCDDRDVNSHNRGGMVELEPDTGPVDFSSDSHHQQQQHVQHGHDTIHGGALGGHGGGLDHHRSEDDPDPGHHHTHPHSHPSQRASMLHQWIGSTGTGTGGVGPTAGALPASTLLRQLYSTRESVLRPSAVVAAGNGHGHGHGHGHGAGGYIHDLHNAGLPTPPNSGSDPTASLEGYPVPFVTSGPYSAAAAAAAAAAVSTAPFSDYHTSAVTPPSSVSPSTRIPDPNKHSPGLGMPNGSDSSNLRSRHQQYLTAADSAGLLPLKPQPYVAAGPGTGLDSGQFSPSTGLIDPQLYSHSAATAGFHVYHTLSAKAAAGAYAAEAIKNGTNWFPPSS